MGAQCWERGLESLIAPPLYLRVGFILCLHSWLVWYHLLVARVHSIVQITCPLDFSETSSQPEASWKAGVWRIWASEICCWYVVVTVAAVTLWRLPHKKGRDPFNRRVWVHLGGYSIPHCRSDLYLDWAEVISSLWSQQANLCPRHWLLGTLVLTPWHWGSWTE